MKREACLLRRSGPHALKWHEKQQQHPSFTVGGRQYEVKRPARTGSASRRVLQTRQRLSLVSMVGGGALLLISFQEVGMCTLAFTSVNVPSICDLALKMLHLPAAGIPVAFPDISPQSCKVKHQFDSHQPLRLRHLPFILRHSSLTF